MAGRYRRARVFASGAIESFEQSHFPLVLRLGGNRALLVRRTAGRKKGRYITHEYNRGRLINPTPYPLSGLGLVQGPIAWSSSP